MILLHLTIIYLIGLLLAFGLIDLYNRQIVTDGYPDLSYLHSFKSWYFLIQFWYTYKY